MRLRHVTLHQLRIFASLAETMSFTRAAEELHLSQPAVSIQVKRLEESVGMPLVEQIGKRIFLTQAGRELATACTDVLGRLRVLSEDMSGMEEGVKGPINLAAITSAKYFMPHLLGVFLRDYPAVEPRLTITNQSRVLARLRDNEDDLVIMGSLPEEMASDLEARFFLDNPLVVVAPPDHPLVGEKNIPLARIAEERFLAREPGSGTRGARTRLFVEHGLSANVYMELGSSEAIKRAVMAGLGISVLSLHSLGLELEAGLLTILDVEHFPLMRQWYAVHRRDKKLSNTASRFLAFLLQDGSRIWSDVRPHMRPAEPDPSAKAKKTRSRKRSGE